MNEKLDKVINLIDFEDLPNLIVIEGATASGKSDLAIELTKSLSTVREFSGAGTGIQTAGDFSAAVAGLRVARGANLSETDPSTAGATSLETNPSTSNHRKPGADIINTDSYSRYKYMDVGTAKVTQVQRDELLAKYGVRHFQIDVLEPTQRSTVAQFALQARAEIEAIHAKNRIPILCGGSGLYIRALTDGFDFAAGEKTEIERNNRANDRHRGELPEYTDYYPKTLHIGVEADLKTLDERIKLRTQKMRDLGLEAEVHNLYKKGLLGETAAKAIGYAEFIAYFKGEQHPAFERQLTLDDTFELIEIHTKRLVRKQMTWFKRDPRIHWI